MPGSSDSSRTTSAPSSRALSMFPRRCRWASESMRSGRLNTDWYVVYVQTSRERPDRIDSEAQRHLLSNIDKARELGAEVVRLESDSPAEALIDFARSHRVSDLLVGRTALPCWRRLVHGSVVERLVREAEGIDLHVVSFEEEPRP